MRTMTIYVEKDSMIHNVDPLTKLLFVFVSVAMTYILPTYHFIIVVFVFTLFLLFVGKVLNYTLPVISVSFMLITSIIIIQSLFHPDRATPIYDIGPFTIYKEGITFAFLVTLRIFNMICAFGLLILTTKPDDLVQALINLGLSAKIGYVILSVLQIIPQMIRTTDKISDAQRSRGMETEGKLLTRIKSFIPLITPVVLNSLNDTLERSIALEIRGFNATGKRTILNNPTPYKYGLVFKVLLLMLLVGTIFWRVMI